MADAGIALSVIVPCYNAEKTVERCVASLLAQTRDDIEIICVNDGSRDGTAEILERLEAEGEGRVHVLTQENAGLWMARWNGRALAQGAYLGFIDSDDHVDPTYAEKLLAAAEESGADIVVSGFDRVDEETGKVLSLDLCQERTPFVVADDPGRTVEVNPAAWNKIYRRELIMNMRGLETPPPILEDLMMQLLLYLDIQGPIAFVGEPLIHYMVHADSMINTVTWAQVEATYEVLRQVRAHYDEPEVSDEMRAAFDTIAFLHIGVSLNYRLSCGDELPVGEAVKRSTAFLDEVAPTWRESPYLRGSYVRTHGASYQRLRLAWHAYRLGLMTPFLSTYRFVTTHFGDIKW